MPILEKVQLGFQEQAGVLSFLSMLQLGVKLVYV